MPTSTYTPLANITLGSSAASVTFSSISQAYRDLILISDYTGSTTAVVVLTFNGDASNYSTVNMFGNSGNTGSGTGTSLNIGAMYGSNKATNILNVMDYTATDKHKTILTRTSNAAQSEVVALAGRWASTSAITSFVLAPTSGTLAAGSTFSLFGVAA